VLANGCCGAARSHHIKTHTNVSAIRIDDVLALEPQGEGGQARVVAPLELVDGEALLWCSGAQLVRHPVCVVEGAPVQARLPVGSCARGVGAGGVLAHGSWRRRRRGVDHASQLSIDASQLLAMDAVRLSLRDSSSFGTGCVFWHLLLFACAGAGVSRKFCVWVGW